MCGIATSQTHRIIGYPAMITNLEALDGVGGGGGGNVACQF